MFNTVFEQKGHVQPPPNHVATSMEKVTIDQFIMDLAFDKTLTLK